MFTVAVCVCVCVCVSFFLIIVFVQTISLVPSSGREKMKVYYIPCIKVIAFSREGTVGILALKMAL